MGKKELDLDEIEKHIDKLGGIQKVNNDDLWDQVAKALGLKNGGKLKAAYMQNRGEEEDPEEDEEDEESEPEYEVERIENEKEKDGTTYYSVKWKGFSSAENTWEPVENLTNAKELLEEWEKTKKKNASSKKTVTKANGNKKEEKTTPKKDEKSSKKEKEEKTPPKKVEKTTPTKETPSKKKSTSQDDSEEPLKKKSKKGGKDEEESPKVPENSKKSSTPSKEKEKSKEDSNENSSQVPTKQIDFGFEHGDELDEIVGCKRSGSTIYLWCTWVGRGDVATSVKSESLHEHAPQKLINFYEQHLRVD